MFNTEIPDSPTSTLSDSGNGNIDSVCKINQQRPKALLIKIDLYGSRGALKKMLEKAGFDVEFGPCDVESAIRLLEESRENLDAVFSGLFLHKSADKGSEMDEQGGLSVLNKAKELGCDNVVLVTGEKRIESVTDEVELIHLNESISQMMDKFTALAESCHAQV